MAGLQFVLVLALFSAVAIAKILPFEGNPINEEIAQLKAQMEIMNQRLETLEEKVKNCEKASNDEAAIQLVQPLQEPEDNAVFHKQTGKTERGNLGVTGFNDNVNPTDELEKTVQILTEGTLVFQHCLFLLLQLKNIFQNCTFLFRFKLLRHWRTTRMMQLYLIQSLMRL